MPTRETWAPIKGFEGSYEVSDLGRVRSLPRLIRRRGGITKLPGKVLTPGIGSHGYPGVILQLDGRRTARCVHRLVADTFLPNPSSLPQVNHMDGIKTNCGVSNLEWCTGSWNTQHAYDTGLANARGRSTECARRAYLERRKS